MAAEQLNMNGLSLSESQHAPKPGQQQQQNGGYGQGRSAYIPPHMRGARGGPAPGPPAGFDGPPPMGGPNGFAPPGAQAKYVQSFISKGEQILTGAALLTSSLAALADLPLLALVASTATLTVALPVVALVLDAHPVDQEMDAGLMASTSLARTTRVSSVTSSVNPRRRVYRRRQVSTSPTTTTSPLRLLARAFLSPSSPSPTRLLMTTSSPTSSSPVTTSPHLSRSTPFPSSWVAVI
jgi:hypothetical protein